jgi:hypothetical protein
LPRVTSAINSSESSIVKPGETCFAGVQHQPGVIMAKGNRSQKKEIRKKKKEKPKAAPAPSRRGI